MAAAATAARANKIFYFLLHMCKRKRVKVDCSQPQKKCVHNILVVELSKLSWIQESEEGGPPLRISEVTSFDLCLNNLRTSDGLMALLCISRTLGASLAVIACMRYNISANKMK